MSAVLSETFLEAVHILLYFNINPSSFHCLQISLPALCIFQTMIFMGINCREVQKCAVNFRLFLLFCVFVKNRFASAVYFVVTVHNPAQQVGLD